MNAISPNLHIHKVGYLCDLGNIETMDGRHIKPHLLYRSSLLNSINEKTIDFLKNTLHIQTVVDLRTPEEVAYRPDVHMEDVDYFNFPLLEDKDNPVITRKTRIPYIKKCKKEDGGTKFTQSNCYRKLISSDLAIAGYRMIFNHLLSGPTPTLWHCTQGKDRTGITTVLILLALGVDKETAIRDYLGFNRARRVRNLAILFGTGVVALKPRIAKQLRYCILARKILIESAFDEIETKYGSIENYFHDAIQLSNDDINHLRELYLE